MAATASVIRTDLLNAVEDNGAVNRLVTRSRVTGLTSTGIDVLKDALAVSGIPAAGSGLADYPNLVLVQRNPTIVEGDPGAVDIDLVYEVLKNKGQNLDVPFASVIVGEVRVDVQQVTATKDIFGDTITVQHTWPSDDEDQPGETTTQVGEVQAYVAQRTFTIRGIKIAARPWLIANAIAGKVNAASWSGEGPHQWLCTGIAWGFHDRSGADRYSMEFTFQHNANTWDPDIVYIDERTGKPPVDLIEDVGFKKVRMHAEANFESILGSRMQGA